MNRFPLFLFIVGCFTTLNLIIRLDNPTATNSDYLQFIIIMILTALVGAKLVNPKTTS